MISNFINRILFSIIAAPIVLLSIYYGHLYFYTLLALIFLVGLLEIHRLKKKVSQFIIFFLLILFLYSCLNIFHIPNGKVYIFLILLITWLSDIGGYFVGKYFGGKKISVISKNKTYNGFLGSIFFSMFAFFYMKFFNFYFFEKILFNLSLLVLSSIIVIIGDLFFSYLKRINNIKDFSNLLKGHGGLFDRIDGLIFLTIFYFFFIKFS